MSAISQEGSQNDNKQTQDYRYKRDELFKRLKVTTFAQLVLQVASVNEQDNGVFEDLQQEEDLNSVVSANEPELGAIKRNDDQSPVEKTQKSPIELISNDESDEKPLTARSTLQSVISGVGEIDLERKQKEFHSKPSECPEKTDGPYPDCPYLLLDVRDRDAYEKCHIIGAYNYPIAMLSRTMNPYTKEVLEYKNTPGKIILLYDEDERIASQAATTLCERGFENLFMLSGGLKVVAQMFPQGLTTGSIPPSCQPPVVPTPRQRRSTAQEPTLPAEDKFRFTEEDLNKIRYSLDEILVPASNYSHLSSSRTRLKTSASHTSSLAGSISARSRTSSIQSKPWK
ncbi:centrosomal protein of 41 kDa isoform X2 [Hypanus sabinus]|uniref:centrosomal protein of 41 kDa isoform X2 n=1 Tax=Hypanus sabinus TaxID=79690 RepID=UPI0028C433C5|nr:centrosomal protein of 41 kDa isoform X2 [Hypanus sabinus]